MVGRKWLSVPEPYIGCNALEEEEEEDEEEEERGGGRRRRKRRRRRRRRRSYIEATLFPCIYF